MLPTYYPTIMLQIYLIPQLYNSYHPSDALNNFNSLHIYANFQTILTYSFANRKIIKIYKNLNKKKKKLIVRIYLIKILLLIILICSNYKYKKEKNKYNLYIYLYLYY